MEEVKLGQEVRDKITGFKGIVAYITEVRDGCDRASVQPPVDKDGKIPEGWDIDVPVLEVIRQVIPEPERTAPIINIDDKVRDPITGYEGIVINRTRHLNGCVLVRVVAKYDGNHLLAEDRLKGVGFPETRLVKVAEAAEKRPAAKTGGAHTRSERF